MQDRETASRGDSLQNGGNEAENGSGSDCGAATARILGAADPFDVSRSGKRERCGGDGLAFMAAPLSGMLW